MAELNAEVNVAIDEKESADLQAKDVARGREEANKRGLFKDIHKLTELYAALRGLGASLRHAEEEQKDALSQKAA